MSFDSQRFRFLGLGNQVEVTTLDGSTTTLAESYLDSAATSLMPESVLLTVEEYLLTAQANSHTHASARGRATTKAIEDVRALVLNLVGANAEDCAVFVGSGSTGALNLAAQILYPNVPEKRELKPLVLISEMEHHSNMLPWRRAAGFENVVYFPVLDTGEIDMPVLRALLKKHRGHVRVVACSAMSNVTGVIVDVHAIAALAHEAGAVIVVDAAQAAPHIQVAMHEGETLDFVALSGHKLYAPGSPGVLIGPRSTLSKAEWRVGDVGGGIVDRVELDKVDLLPGPAALIAGTPNILGIVALGAGILLLQDMTIAAVREHEIELTQQAISELSRIENCAVYGPTDPTQRGGIISFNLFAIPHGLTAAILNDSFAISIRNQCFCAQPYVRKLLDATCNQRGMCAPRGEFRRGQVRASFSPFTTSADILRLTTAVAWIDLNREKLEALYVGTNGSFEHRTFRPQASFDLASAFAAASASV